VKETQSKDNDQILKFKKSVSDLIDSCDCWNAAVPRYKAKMCLETLEAVPDPAYEELIVARQLLKSFLTYMRLSDPVIGDQITAYFDKYPE